MKIEITGLDKFVEAMELLAHTIAQTQQKASAPNGASKNTKEAPKEEPKQDITLDDIRKAFMQKNTKANRPKLKSILEDLGAKKITDLSEEQYNQAMHSLGDV